MSTLRNRQRGTGRKSLKTTDLEVRDMRKYKQSFLGLSCQWNRRKLEAMCRRHFYEEGMISSGQHNTAESLAKMRTKNSLLDLVPSGHR